MVIWIPAAWNHVQVTGDTNFLATAYTVAVDTLNKMRNEHYDATNGLFKVRHSSTTALPAIRPL